MGNWRAILGVLLILAAAPFLLFGGGTSAGRYRTKLVVWGLQSGPDTAGLSAMVAEFERRNPGVKVQVLQMGAGEMDPQKLMTSIVGGTPPDVIRQDRFTIGDWASRDTFTCLDPYLKRDAGEIREADFYPACWREAVYKGKVYAIPFGTDDRALYYNRSLFREAGLDPDKPPKTWDELLAMAVKLTKYNPNGSFRRIGFIPNFGNSWLYLYSWQNGGEFMSPDGRTCTLANPRTVGALEWMVGVYDKLKGADEIGAFSSTFQGNELDAFLVGKVAMRIDGNGFLEWIARYAPDLDFAVAPAPVPADRLAGRGIFRGQPPFITWSGGFSLAIPRGARNKELAWKFVKWMSGVEAARVNCRAQAEYNRLRGRRYVPEISANRRANRVIWREFAPREPKFRKALQIFLGLMPYSKFRPVTFVGQRLWDEHVRAFDMAIHHKLSPKTALLAGRRTVQRELDKVYARERHPLLNWAYPLSAMGLAALALAGFVWRRSRGWGRMGRQARAEARAGVLFASPWIIGFLALTLGPIATSIALSFCDYDVLHPARYLGWQNYRELLGEDWHYLGWSLYNAGELAAIGIPLGIITSLAIAMLLNAKVMGMTWYRTIYYLPAIVPVVASAILWMWVLNPDQGLLNSVINATLGQWFGIHPPGWLSSQYWARPSLILMGLWGAGGGMILWLAGLQGVPRHLYEAAEIDGAGSWSKFRHVTVPMLTPYIFFNLIMGTIGALQTFDTVYIMTRGGPVDSTSVPVFYLFNNAFTYFKMGYASALAWILFAIIMALTAVQLKLAPRWVHYEAEK